MPTDREKYNKIFWTALILINISILAILSIIIFSGKDYSINQILFHWCKLYDYE